jgi:fatty-acyl-CoA synthase
MAEATLAISFAETPDGVLRTDRVDVEAFRQGEARPAAEGAASVEVVSCGRPLPDHEVRVVDPDGNFLPDRVVGELVVRGPSVCHQGYHENPEATAQSFRNGWLHTGRQGLCGRRRRVRLRPREGHDHRPRAQLLPPGHRVGGQRG